MITSRFVIVGISEGETLATWPPSDALSSVPMQCTEKLVHPKRIGFGRNGGMEGYLLPVRSDVSSSIADLNVFRQAQETITQVTVS